MELKHDLAVALFRADARAAVPGMEACNAETGTAGGRATAGAVPAHTDAAGFRRRA